MGAIGTGLQSKFKVVSVLFDVIPRILRSAEISECGQYRWSLHRSWELWSEQGEHIKGKGVCCFVMLNPSTADGTQDDPTIRRCIGFAKSWGYTTLSVRNLFSFRATDPRELLSAENPVGGRGDQELITACTADLLVAAWGATVPFERDRQAMVLFREHFPEKTIYCIGVTKGGHPRHPLYVRADVKPMIL